MTAINVFLRPDGAHVMTDGASVCTIDGQLKAVIRKAIPLPHLSAVVAMRGPSCLLAALPSQIEHRRRSFDDAAAHFAEDVRAVAGLRPGEDVQAFLAGWHEGAQSPSAYAVLSTAVGDAPPFSAIPMGGLISPGIEGEDGMDLDFTRRGVALMAAQRKQHPGSIGGVCQITSVYRDRTESHVLACWPDRIGQSLTADFLPDGVSPVCKSTLKS